MSQDPAFIHFTFLIGSNAQPGHPFGGGGDSLRQLASSSTCEWDLQSASLLGLQLHCAPMKHALELP
jgi:hypothetical protein